jgi:hypothetical protein
MPGRSKPKVACVPCARGKRSCSGTFPCERCKRLNKECSYPDDVKRRKKPQSRPHHPHHHHGAGGGGGGGGGSGSGASMVQVELLPHGGGMGALALDTPRPNALSLPRQLFPWQDIRLYAVNTEVGGGAGERRCGVSSLATHSTDPPPSPLRK